MDTLSREAYPVLNGMALLNSSMWCKTVKELDKGAREKSVEGTATGFSLPHAHLITDNIRRRIAISCETSYMRPAYVLEPEVYH